jgi:hypothetical protein
MSRNRKDPHAANNPAHVGDISKKHPVPDSLDHEKGQTRYGQDKDITNHNRDLRTVNAANQQQGEHPDPKKQGREGQRESTGNPPGSNDPYPKTGNRDRGLNKDNDEDGPDPDRIIPEVPLRKEEREQKTPKAGGLHGTEYENLEGLEGPDNRNAVE